jgi:hypothetical protein
VAGAGPDSDTATNAAAHTGTGPDTGAARRPDQPGFVLFGPR